MLYFGVKNKYCFTCSRCEKRGIKIPDHACFKNWDDSSSSMESDAILEGFKCSIEQHGLIYRELVADNDSSVYSKLYNSSVYDCYGIAIKKTECVNHLRRNLCKKILAISSGKIGSKHLRDMIGEKVFNFRAAVTKAADYRRKQNHSLREKIILLRKDIDNIPFHIFGHHEHCDTYFCTKKSSNDTNFTVELEREGLMSELSSVMTNLGLNAESLLEGKVNNAAECFNNVLAKFVGGKRVNFGLTCQYGLRAAAAVLQYNSQAVFSKLNTELGNDSLPLIEGLENSRKRGNDARKISYNLKKITNSFDDSSKSSLLQKKKSTKDYGAMCQCPDMEPEILAEEIDKFKKTLLRWRDERLEVEQRTRNVISNDEKMIKYKKLLTTEHFAKICRKQQNSRCGPIVQAVVYSKLYGSKDESYKIIYKTELLETIEKKSTYLQMLSFEEFQDSGIIIDKKIPYFAALPDAFVNDNILVDIWAPIQGLEFSIHDCRKKKYGELHLILNNDLKLNENHWIFYSIQGKLHISERDVCLFCVITKTDFLEVLVKRNYSFWQQKMENKLVEFYEAQIIPEIVNSRINRSMEIREPLMRENINATEELSTTEDSKRFKNTRSDNRIKKIYLRGEHTNLAFEVFLFLKNN